jgi:RNA methyltransferase, TrmH family
MTGRQAGFIFPGRSSCLSPFAWAIMSFMTIIASTSNPKIKQLRALRRRKVRETEGLCVVEGLFHAGEALAAYEAGMGTPIEYLCYAPDLLTGEFGRSVIERAARIGIPTYAVTAEVLASAADKDHPQGLLAVVQQRHQRLAALSPADLPWAVALVAPQDPGNVGTVLRTIDAVGASGLILLDDSVDPYHPTALRAAMGTTFWYPVVTATFQEFADWSQQQGYHLYGTSVRAEHDYLTAHFEPPLILLMGSERKGLTPEQAAICQELIRLPMRGRAGSLNLAVATGVFLYEILNQLIS